MSRVDIKSGGGGVNLNAGILQLQNGVAMDATLRNVADQLNTASQLKLSTTLTQVAGTLQIALDGGSYIDAQDTSGVDRFNVNRASASQQVNVDFRSNPTSATDAVGAIRTFKNGVSLSEALTVLRNGNVGVGTVSPLYKLTVSSGVVNGYFNPNAVSGVLYIGTYSNHPISFAPNDIERFTILTNGNVGISETAPTARLQVKGSGSTSATTSLLVQNSAGVSSLQVTDDGSVFNYGKGSVTSSIAFGVLALSSNSSGQYNTAIGSLALRDNTTGGFNTAVGYNALKLNNGNENSAFGVNSLQNNTLGSSNSALGFGTSSGNFSGSTILGVNATATANNQFVVGSTGTVAGAVVAEINTSTNVWNVVINGVARKILLA